MKEIIIVLIVILMGTSYGGAQITFNRQYSFTSVIDQGYEVMEEEDGYVICGYGTDTTLQNVLVIRIFKVDTFGNILWTEVYGDTAYNYAFEKGFIKYRGGYIITGIRIKIGSGVRDGMIIRVDSIGNEVFRKFYGGTFDDQFFNGTVDAAGNIYGIGETFSFGDPDGDIYVVKADSMGNLLYEKAFGGAGKDRGLDIEIFMNQIYLSGFTNSFGASMGRQSYIVKVNDSLSEISSWDFGSPNNDCSVYLLKYNKGSINRLYIIGCHDSIIGGNALMISYLAEIDSQGQILWKKYLNTSEKQNIVAYNYFDSTGVFMGGWIYPDEFNNTKDVGWILKYTLDGDLVYDRRYTVNNAVWTYGLSYAEIRGVTATSDGGVIATGNVAGISSDYWLLKLDSNGCVGNYCGLTDTSCYYQPFPCDTIIDTCPIPPCVGIDERLNGVAFKLYPNPANDKLIVEYELSGDINQVELVIYSMLGKLEKRISLDNPSDRITLSTSDLSSGVYLYNLVSQNAVIDKGKLVIIK